MGDYANVEGGRGLNPLSDTASRYFDSLFSLCGGPFFEKDRLPPTERRFLDYLGKIALGDLDIVETAAEWGKRHEILDYETMVKFALEMGESSIKLKIKNSKKTLSKYKLDSHS